MSGDTIIRDIEDVDIIKSITFPIHPESNGISIQI